MNIEVSASILSADFSHLSEAIALGERCGVDRFHIDVMDGHFVPNISIGPVILEAVRRCTNRTLAVHLMIEHPWDYLEAFVKAGANIIAVQAECYGPRRLSCLQYGQYPKEVDDIDATRIRRDLQRIRDLGCKACLVINPGTPVSCLDHVLLDVDSLLIMSVNPGFSGQKFMPAALDKIRDLRSCFKGDIAIDGGVNEASAPDAVKAGANVLVTASYFYNSKDPKGVVQYLKNLPQA